jgi:hypothetical protein
MTSLLVAVLLCIAIIYLLGQLGIPKTPDKGERVKWAAVIGVLVLWLLVCLGMVNLPVCLRG